MRKEKRRKEKRKEENKYYCREGGFPGAGPTLLAVHWVTAVRCN
jgi:hypothetical protein